MQYRTLGRTGQQVSAIGLGTEYLLNVPQEQAVAVIRTAIERGVNYFDLFWANPAFRDVMGVAFTGYRQRVMLAAHLGSADRDGQYDRTRDPAECEAYFDDFLHRYHTDYVDVLYLHNINEQSEYDLVMNGPVLELALRLQREGKARYLAFSGHMVSTSRQAVESDLVDLLMFPVNLTGHAVPGKRELFQACVAHNVALVAMKPFAGGRLLLGNESFEVDDFQMGYVTGGAPERRATRAPVTPARCLAYVLSQPGVATIVPGAKNLDELEAAMAYWEAPEADKDYAAILSDFEQYHAGECCYCNHCQPCPADIDIGQVLRSLDLAQSQGSTTVQAAYDALPAKASDCLECGACVERCPFGVDVTEHMRTAAALLG